MDLLLTSSYRGETEARGRSDGPQTLQRGGPTAVGALTHCVFCSVGNESNQKSPRHHHQVDPLLGANWTVAERKAMSAKCQAGVATPENSCLRRGVRATAEPLRPQKEFAADWPRVGVLCPSLCPWLSPQRLPVPGGYADAAAPSVSNKPEALGVTALGRRGAPAVSRSQLPRPCLPEAARACPPGQPCLLHPRPPPILCRARAFST